MCNVHSNNNTIKKFNNFIIMCAYTRTFKNILFFKTNELRQIVGVNNKNSFIIDRSSLYYYLSVV